MTDRVWLIIAHEGEYSTRTNWIVQVLLDGAAAAEEAARLNAEIPIRDELLREYWRRWREKRNKVLTPAPWNSPEVTAPIDKEMGPPPERPADGYAVLSVPVNVRGRWSLPDEMEVEF